MKTAALIMSSLLLSVVACAPSSNERIEETDRVSAASSSTCGWGHERYSRDIITRGADIHATNGVRFGPDGLLYVASVLERAIVVLNPHTGGRVRTLGNEVGVETPDDLTFGPDGSLYWTSFLTGEVGRLTPDGVKHTVALLAPGVNPIAFSPAGRLFVGRVFLGDELYELDPDGIVAPRLVASNLGGINSMQFGADGKLYAPLWFLGQVARLDPETGAVEVIASDIGTPTAVKFAPNGDLFALDTLRGELLRVNASTGSKTVVASGLEGSDGVAFNASGRAFISNSGNGSITEILPHGRKRVVLEGGVAAPGGIAILERHGKDMLYVADTLSLKVIDPRRERVTDELHVTIGVTPLATPISASADGDNLIVTSWFANTVQVFDPVTQTASETHTDFAVPIDALRFQGDLAVSELGTGTVTRKNAAGTKTTLASGLIVPSGLAATNDDLYVAEWATGRVLEIVANGVTLPTPRVVATGLAQPEGLALDVDGTLLVVETGTKQLSRIHRTTGAVSVIEDHLQVGLPGVPGLPPTHLFNGVTVSREGTIYLTLDVTNQVLALRRRDRCH